MLFDSIAKRYIKKLNKEYKNRGPIPKDKNSFKLSNNLSVNTEKFKKLFGASGDIKYHTFIFSKFEEDKCLLLYIDGMASDSMISETIIKPLMFAGENKSKEEKYTAQHIKNSVLFSGDIKFSADSSEMIKACLSGDTVLLIENDNKGLIISTKGFETRGITEPQTEQVIRGPREGFTESFRINTSLLRRKIKNPDFKIEQLIKGRKTNTDISIAYIEGIAKPSLIKLVKKRIQNLSIDAILDNGYIEDYIEDAPFSIFSTVGYTEKPDVAAAKILEGRVAILVDGSPFALTVPYLFIENFQMAEDYYIRPFFATMLRIMRFFAYLVAIYMIPAYMAFSTFHQELIPTTLLFTFAQAREGTPFTSFIEALILVLSFEILREAGLRLPRPIGQAISIVGALIMGDAAVSAGLVGSPMVIVVAISAVSSFVVPEQLEVISISRILFMVLAAVLGGFGVLIGFLGVLIHLASLKSFGINYFESFLISSNNQDALLRAPLWLMQKRPTSIAYKDKTRIKAFIPPNPKEPDQEEDKTNE